VNMPPSLPKKHKREEAKYDDPVAEWFEKNYENSVALEVKVKGGKVKPHQKAALGKVAEGSFRHKLPDQGQRNPFDYFVLKGADAFVVVVDPKTKECICYDPLSDAEQFRFSLKSPKEKRSRATSKVGTRLH